MHWIHLTDEGQLQKIIVKSHEKPQVIFKYGTKCGLSEAILNRLQKDCCPHEVDFHFLDFRSHEDISTKITETFHVAHQSPQVLLIQDCKCVFKESDAEISLEKIMQYVPAAPRS